MIDPNASAAAALEAVRERRVLVHSITNYVVMNWTANVLLAAGAAPVMAHAREEVEEMAALAAAVVLNIGTLSAPWVAAMEAAGAAAARSGRPVILDPVGAGATSYRTQTARRLARDLAITVIRGNASEILSVAGLDAATRGVDAANDPGEAARVAAQLARRLGTTVAVTGAVDLVTDGARTLEVHAGHPLLARVTGTGCAATALVAAFSAVEQDPVLAAAGALAAFGMAAERAAERAPGPGSFQIALLDALSQLAPGDLAAADRLRSTGA